MWRELQRKFFHKVLGLAFAFAPLYIETSQLLLIALAFLAGVMALYFLPRTVFPALSESLHIDGRSSFGAVWHIVGIAVTAFLFLPEQLWAYMFGVLVMTLSDTAAALIGRRFGRVEFMIFGYKKSAEGSFAFFLVTLGLLLLFAPAASLYHLVAIAVLLTNVELFSVWGLDNLTLPPVAAALLLLV